MNLKLVARRARMVLLVGLVALGLPRFAHADAFRLVVESNADAPSGSEIGGLTYATWADFLSSPPGGPGGGAFTPLNIAAAFSIAAVTYDGAYRVVIESDADGPSGFEIGALTYATWADFLSSPPGGPGGGAFTPLNIAPGFSIAAIMYDGAYRVIVESDADGPSGFEIGALTYATWADFLSSPPGGPGGGAFTPLNIAPGFSIAAVTYDGAYRVIVESDADGPSGFEVGALTYATWADFLSSPPGGPGGGAFTPLNIAPGFSIAALAFEPDSPSVPEPATWAMLIVGGVGFARRRQRPPT